ncbi:MAG: tRNA (adenosine(37)-N6)-dimethylallyltransferase MiaA [Clostridia bacterium]|nr:tRNA (adenosine(37)-N6)-dimethylallyltransferase MiaA [Clostridia bacterium]
MGKPCLIAIAGATASGKTAAAVKLCQRIGGEVVSCDSMQVYRGMDIGTAKPDPAERGGIPHHMLDIVDPAQSYSVSAFHDQAAAVIEDILARGRQPVLCGGTGLYIDALTRPMAFSEQADEGLRDELRALAALPDGKGRLHAMLEAVDPESARRLHENDLRRVTRAIEIYRLTGRTMTEQMALDREREGDYRVKLFALDWPREVLYERINRRVDQMMARGLVDEVAKLIRQGIPPESTAMQALGYKEIAMALDNRCTIAEAVEAIKLGSRHYAKRQLTWLRRDGRAHWIQAQNRSVDDIVSEIMREIHNDAD